MNPFFSFCLLCSLSFASLSAQDIPAEQAIHALIDSYSQARESSDAKLLDQILTADIDQLVSSGEWRTGKNTAMKGMKRSSTNNPGTRTLSIDQIRFLDEEAAIVDCRYDITREDGTARNMWSTFIVVLEKGTWKISAIRNMLPAK